MDKAIKYTVARYGDVATVNKYRPTGESFEEFCSRFYRESTGDGETRDPKTLTLEEYQHFTYTLYWKKNETLGDYRMRQFDYWAIHHPTNPMYKTKDGSLVSNKFLADLSFGNIIIPKKSWFNRKFGDKLSNKIYNWAFHRRKNWLFWFKIARIIRKI